MTNEFEFVCCKVIGPKAILDGEFATVVDCVDVAILVRVACEPGRLDFTTGRGVADCGRGLVFGMPDVAGPVSFTFGLGLPLSGFTARNIGGRASEPVVQSKTVPKPITAIFLLKMVRMTLSLP
jgi:hypothetical protein